MSRLSKEETMSARLMSVKELSGVLPLSVNTLYCWVSQRRIPYVKCGRLTRFNLSEIQRWLADNSFKENKC